MAADLEAPPEKAEKVSGDAEKPLPRASRAPPSWWVFALLKLAWLCLIETLWSLFTWSCRQHGERPVLTYEETARNKQIIANCPALEHFPYCPWSLYANSNTLLSIIYKGKKPVPRLEEVLAPDGVALHLLWFEPPNAAPDVPIVVSLHGIGGDENAVRPIMLAEDCLRRGWRSVMFLRRGHGNSSLLPVAPPGGSKGKEQSVAEAGADSQAEPSTPVHPAPPALAVLPSGADTPADAAAPATQPASPVGAAGPDLTPSPGGSADPAPSPRFPKSIDEETNACLPRGMNLPALPTLPSLPSLPNLALPLGRHAPPPTPPVDMETLQKTRKAFPQHADTEDFQVVLQHIQAARPQAPLTAVGFSMGTNVLVKFLGEHPTDTPEGREANPLVAAVSVSNGYDIVEGTRHLVSKRPLADRVITASLHKLLRRKLPEVASICAAHGLLVDFDEVLACNTIREFEAALMLPIVGLKDLDEYYTNNNPKQGLQSTSVPLLCLSARDDPIIDPALLRHAEAAAAANPNLILAVTQRGGHLGWLSGWRGTSWSMQVTCEFLEATVKDWQAQRAPGAAATAAAVPTPTVPAGSKPAEVSAAPAAAPAAAPQQAQGGAKVEMALVIPASSGSAAEQAGPAPAPAPVALAQQATADGLDAGNVVVEVRN
ncbi:hypothetical protein HYH03_005475 [Edaphochlamys debaryana]|uniref:Uncharacterized protein n=1 Tax=Edaphochlamys debaryana TaxID=47281 RepID=A0A835YD61_9CHLO|nr:hypothetical protein HYH03_005475 [Edaphochlamys debaryana]|eukprot:KAG2496655.1 hypothetical protein HYH03_005475 [Edaphochlamys debaryana]